MLIVASLVRAILSLCLVCLLPLALAAPAAAAIPPGDSTQTAAIGDTTLTLFLYRPFGCALTGVLVVFHGLGRDASGYRDFAEPLGNQLCMVVVAPLFDAARFPTWRYQHGGIVHDGRVLPAEKWTVSLVPKLVDWARAQEQRPDLPYTLLGHSAGGQFLSRVAAFVPLQATRIVVADPSTWVLPSLDTKAPFGFGGVYDPAQGEAALRRYLAAPITVLVGQEDTGSRELAITAEANAQGRDRLQRARNVFQQAQATAQAHGWPCNWRFVLVPGVAHSARRNFATTQTLDALRP